MIRRGHGRILFTGSVAGFMPGTFQPVYNGTKAFIDSFAIALRHELKDSGVSVTVLMPGAAQTRFFERADMMDTEIGVQGKDSPVDVARDGYDATMAARNRSSAVGRTRCRSPPHMSPRPARWPNSTAN